MSDAWIDDWLGFPRFQKYVDACGGDRARALALYEWNVSLGQALMRDIAHFEIALRNTHDAAFTPRWPGNDHWLLDPDSPAVTPIWRIRRDRSKLKRGSDVNYRNRRAVDEAIRKCGGVRATPGKVMAEPVLASGAISPPLHTRRPSGCPIYIMPIQRALTERASIRSSAISIQSGTVSLTMSRSSIGRAYLARIRASSMQT